MAKEQSQYPRPAVTVDLVIFSVASGRLQMLLIQRAESPFQGHWALPGGFVHVGDGIVEQGESIEDAAHRELAEETGLARGSVFLEQLQTFGKPYRDPRARVITVAWTALIPPDRIPEVKAGSEFWYAEDYHRTRADFTPRLNHRALTEERTL